MTLALRPSLILALALVTLACGRTEPDQETPIGTPPPGQPLLTREGRYTMVAAGDDSLPASVDWRPGCRLQITAGALTLQDRRFAFTSTARELCDGQAAGRVATHEARGTYAVDRGSLFLSTEQGTAFGVAKGDVSDDGLRLRQLETNSGPKEVEWVFRRDGP